jgi:hypothetical protein
MSQMALARSVSWLTLASVAERAGLRRPSWWHVRSG